MADRLASIRKQIVALEKRAAELARAENKKIIDRIKDLIDKHQISAEDLGFAAGATSGNKSTVKPPVEKSRGAKRTAVAKKGASKVGVPQFRDPKSGKTWTGRGKPPAWIAGSRDRTRFLIDAESSSATGGPVNPAKSRKSASPRKAAKVAKATSKKKTPARREEGSRPSEAR